MEDNKIIFTLTSTDGGNIQKYAKLLSENGYTVYRQNGDWRIELSLAKDLFDIYKLVDETNDADIIVTSYYYGGRKGEPIIEIYDDYRE